MSEQIGQVSDTAFMAAAFRACELNHPNAIFRDPLAEKLAGKRGKKIIESLPKKAFMGGWSVLIRTRIIDDFILSAVAEGVDTVLNLGAGLDTRAYRMTLPESLNWIEVDYPHVIEFKTTRLSEETPHCQLERVKLDLADIDARRQLLTQVAAQSTKVLVLTEAVTPYLTEDAVASLGEDLYACVPIIYWLVDYFSPASYEYRRRSGMSKSMKNAPFLFEPRDYFAFFSRLSWTPKQIKYFATEAERLNRPPPFPLVTRLLISAMGFLASSDRRQAMQQYAGFVLFEREPVKI